MHQPSLRWLIGEFPSTHRRLTGPINHVAPFLAGPNGRPGVVAAGHRELALLEFPSGRTVAGPWPVGATAAVLIGHGESAVVAGLTEHGWLFRLDPLRGGYAELAHSPYEPMSSGVYRRLVQGHRRYMEPIAVPGVELVATVVPEGDVEIWSVDARTEEPVQVLQLHGGVTALAAFGSGDVAVLALGGRHGRVALWRFELAAGETERGLVSQQLFQTQLADDSEVSAVTVAHVDGAPLVVAAAATTAHGWSVTGQPCLGPVETGHERPVLTMLVMHHGGQDRLWTSDGDTVGCWDMASPTSAAPLYAVPAIDDAALTSVAFAADPNGVMLVKGCGNGVVRLFEPRPGRTSPAGLTVDVSRRRPVPWDERWYVPRRVATATVAGRPAVLVEVSDETVRAFDLADGAELPVPGVGARMISTGGRVLLVHHADGTFRWFDPTDGTVCGPTADVDRAGLTEVIAVADLGGQPVAVLNGGYHLYRVDLDTGRQLGGAMRGHTDRIHAITVVDVGGTPVVVSCAQDNTIRFWDLRTGRRLGAPISGHGGGVFAAASGGCDDGTPFVLAAGRGGDVVRYDLVQPPGRLHRRRLPAQTVLRVGRPVQSLAVWPVSNGWRIVIGSESSVLCADSDGRILSTAEFADTVTDIATGGSTVVVATGSGLYAYDGFTGLSTP